MGERLQVYWEKALVGDLQLERNRNCRSMLKTIKSICQEAPIPAPTSLNLKFLDLMGSLKTRFFV